MKSVLVRVTRDVMTITLNRPERLNAVTVEMMEALAESLAEAVASEVRAVVITGAGRGFCAGADLRGAPSSIEPPSRRIRQGYNATILQLAQLPMPVVAAINGPTAGAGLSIAGAADVRIAADDAIFVSGFIDVGMATDTGASYFLASSMGYSKAFAFLASGRRYTADQAVAAGLVDETVRAQELDERAHDLAEELASKASAGVRHLKVLLRQATATALATQMEAELMAYDVISADPERVAARADRAKAVTAVVDDADAG